ncbi:hypothetical protein LCGC14_1928360 [marine sediment metagenome]|uniref:Uncharacterized protein n=1 Tax=marine sediment metagenome TaxID=412755 RepID=A0A0F9GC41_9ZZZZ
MSELANLKFLEEFLDAHITFIVRDGRINQDRAATLSDLQDFMIDNMDCLCENQLIEVLVEIQNKWMTINQEAIEVAQLRMENVFGMTGKVESEICIVEGRDG